MTRAERTAAQDAAVLAAITRAAENGQPCPTNDVLAGLISADSAATSVKVMRRLEKRGLIVVERFGMSRIVTVVESGKRTTGEPKRVHWRHRDPAAPVKHKPKPAAAPAAPAVAKPEPVRVDREPCFYCNIRADIGCKHSRRPAPALSFPSVHR